MIFHSLLSSPEELRRREASFSNSGWSWTTSTCLCLIFVFHSGRNRGALSISTVQVAPSRGHACPASIEYDFAPPRQITPDFLFTADGLYIPQSRRSDVRTAMYHRFGSTRVYMRSFQILCAQCRIPSGTSGRAKTKHSNRVCTGSLSQRLPVFAVNQPTVTPTRLNIAPSARVQCYKWIHQRDGDSSSSLCRRREDRP